MNTDPNPPSMGEPQIDKRRDIRCLFFSIGAAVGVLLGVIIMIITRSSTPSASTSALEFEAISTDHPSLEPSNQPSSEPSLKPSLRPTLMPSSQPSSLPSDAPSLLPSHGPSTEPSALPSINPSKFPSANPSKFPSAVPSANPSAAPSAYPSIKPTNKPTPFITAISVTGENSTFSTTSENVLPPISNPTPNPTHSPTPNPTPSPSCFSSETYDSIDADIVSIKNNFSDNISKSHFLGGVVRLVAHDFMDYDQNDDDPMGPDGCFDASHSANNGLGTIWCDECELTNIYKQKYSHLSRADFWIASAQAVIRQTSINNALNLKDKFRWGRKDTDSCPGSAERLPSPTGCRNIEGVFLDRMGLDWKDAVALMGAHTLGRGNKSFSGHHGTWVASDEGTLIFDKAYYEELYRHAWRPRNEDTSIQDWTRSSSNRDSPKMMLNTDICLVYDIDQKFPCCSRTNLFSSDGSNACNDKQLSKTQCVRYSENDSRMAATEAVKEYLGGTSPNTNNEPFYNAFTEAWIRATTSGWEDLLPLSDSCQQ